MSGDGRPAHAYYSLESTVRQPRWSDRFGSDSEELKVKIRLPEHHRDFRLTVPETFAMVEWFETLDDWGENVALTRSRHLIRGSLSLDGFRSGWMAAIAALGHEQT